MITSYQKARLRGRARAYLVTLQDKDGRYLFRDRDAIGAAATRDLARMFEEEYARGYHRGHDAGFTEGLCK